jgi:cell division protein ZapD
MARRGPHCGFDGESRRVILYEYPFNERIRTYLRLEHLFGRLGELLQRERARSPLRPAHHLRDHGRGRPRRPEGRAQGPGAQKGLLAAYRGNPAISEASLDAVLAQLEQAFTQLNSQLPAPATS